MRTGTLYNDYTRICHLSFCDLPFVIWTNTLKSTVYTANIHAQNYLHYTNSTSVSVTPVCIAARGSLERTDQLQPRHNTTSAPLAEYNTTLPSWKQCPFEREASYCGSGGVWVYVVRRVCRYVWVCGWLPPRGEP